jgi:hypothetical protein
MSKVDTPLRKLEKIVTVTAIVIRQIPSVDLELGSKILYYLVPVTYDLLDKEEQNTWLVKSNQPIYELENSEVVTEAKYVLAQNLAKVFLRQYAVTCEVTPSSLNAKAYPFLRITKGKSKRITVEQANELLLSGSCLGIFRSLDLDERIIT